MVDFAVIPERTAPVNVDMQNCFVEGSPFSAPDGLIVQQRINRVAAVCRAAGIPVIHTSHVVRADGSNTGVLGEIAPVVKHGIITNGSESASLHKGLVVEPQDILLEKPRFGAFHGTDLELILRSRGIDSIIVTVIATNVCCETTAREAVVRDFRVFFLSDGTTTFSIGDVSAAELQRSTCATLGLLFAQVLTVDEMIAKIATGRIPEGTPSKTSPTQARKGIGDQFIPGQRNGNRLYACKTLHRWDADSVPSFK